jgi:hypothetical protein
MLAHGVTPVCQPHFVGDYHARLSSFALSPVSLQQGFSNHHAVSHNKRMKHESQS